MRAISLFFWAWAVRNTQAMKLGQDLGNILFLYHIRQFALPIVPDATIVGHSRGNILDTSPRDGIACVGLYELLSESLVLPHGRYVSLDYTVLSFWSLGIYNFSRLCVTVKLAET